MSRLLTSARRSVLVHPLGNRNRSQRLTHTHHHTTMCSTIQPSEKVQPELDKGLDCWSVFSPASGHMPPDSLNLGQGFMNWAP
ncbi:hypothetical protein PCASD_24930, partial [Puccinia coronata f. sp. avenae]